MRLAPIVIAHVPRAYVLDAVSGGNWEGTGVLPDVAVPAGAALEAALTVLRR